MKTIKNIFQKLILASFLLGYVFISFNYVGIAVTHEISHIISKSKTHSLTDHLIAQGISHKHLILLQILLEQESKNQQNDSPVKVNEELKLDLHTVSKYYLTNNYPPKKTFLQTINSEKPVAIIKLALLKPPQV